MLDIEAMKERAEKATKGPWIANRAPYKGWTQKVDVFLGRIENPSGYQVYAGPSSFDALHGDDNADFIAHSREDIPALIAEVERLWVQRKEIELWKRAYERDAEFRPHDNIYGMVCRWLSSTAPVSSK